MYADCMSYQPRFKVGGDHKICSIQFKSVLERNSIYCHTHILPSLFLFVDMNFLTFLSSIVS